MQVIPFFNCTIAEYLAIALMVIAVPIFIILLFLPAWYGRYAKDGKCYLGSIPASLAWCFQECPSFLIPFIALIVYASTMQDRIVNVVCLAFFLFHYLYRSFVYPWRIRSGKNTPTEIFIMAFVFCCLNGYIQATSLLSGCISYSFSWLYDPRFILGVVLYVSGMLINWQSDGILRRLRDDHESGYQIPHGGLFEYISGANYFGECVEWLGYAFLTWNWGGWSFALFTCANIGPRAIQHHKWYKETFADYPSTRKAIIPFIVLFVCWVLYALLIHQQTLA